MNGGIFMCVLLVTLSASCLQRAYGSSLREGSVPALLRHARSVAPAMPAMPATDGKGSATNLGELLTKLTSRRASLRKNSTLKSRASAIRANHQLKDRDYLGWMDFGRRSAGEYEYSS